MIVLASIKILRNKMTFDSVDLLFFRDKVAIRGNDGRDVRWEPRSALQLQKQIHGVIVG